MTDQTSSSAAGGASSRDEFPEAVRREIAAHHAEYARDPVKAHWWDPIVIGVPGGPVPCLVLHHTGRKSGRQLNSILQYYRHEDAIAIVASKGGVTNNPAWYLNLLAQPACEVQIATFHSTATARTLRGEERAEWWVRITREQPIQIDYQKRTRREIPLVILEMPVAPPRF